ncbi:MAG: trigger factor [Lachnospiraceae bacterium]|nr:trigger factor [Lachnospiraceae bacterium]
MRKFVKPLLCGMMVAALMAGCSKKENPVTSESPTETSEEASSSAGEESQVPVDLGEVTSLGEYKGLKVDRMSTEVTDEELNTRIQSILDANPEYVAITDRAAKEGDIVDIDYVGMKDGVAFEGGTSEGYKLELGSGSFIDGFEEGLVGAKTGEERSLNLTFPEQYHSEELAGQAVVFDVTVNGIEEKRDAVLDDNFVQRMSDFTTVDEFKADTRADLESEKGIMADQQLETDIFLAAVENSQFSLNEEAVNQQYENQMAYLTSMVQMYGMTMEDYAQMSDMTTEEMEKDLRDNVETSIKVQLLVKAIAEKEGLQVEDADREELAEMYYMSVEELQEAYGKDAVDEVAMSNKVKTFLKDNASINQQ